jgi:hypothetical protein
MSRTIVSLAVKANSFLSGYYVMVPSAKVLPVAGSKEAKCDINLTHFQMFFLPFDQAELVRRAFNYSAHEMGCLSATCLSTMPSR